ncbi:MAG: multifunctional 2-oxoglutarate metabolism enzyme, partial [Actinomycetota bacterium]|nr:multifunctional 2-oxoglutarate metabolism enzyme [Actinomycetota bacterium]
MSQTGDKTTSPGGFGPNEWLVEELYQQYLADKDSVDKAWWDFFQDYRPDGPPAAPRSGNGAPAPAANPTTSGRPASSPAPQPATPRADGAPTPEPVAQKPAAAPVSPPTPSPAPSAAKTPAPSSTGSGDITTLKGPAARVVTNMQASLAVPTATSVRAVPAKLLIDNRTVINNALQRGRGGKVSFTHLIGFAVVKALAAMPEMNYGFVEQDGKPAVRKPEHVNFGLAIDVQKPDGSRTLLVPSIKGAEAMDFAGFWAAYEDVVRRARSNKLTADDFAGTTISLTNPGTIGTVHSVPRLMAGQGTIVGVGAMEYPAEYQGAAHETLARLAVSKVMTLTSTYDHRIIQGAQSGDFLR